MCKCALADQSVLLGRLARGGPPIVVLLPEPSRSRSQGGGDEGLRDCLAQLQRLLEDSGDSMRTDQGGSSSQTQKAQWWKVSGRMEERKPAPGTRGSRSPSVP